jgi:phosphoribosylformylglycinamidine cyclo-ligase
LDAAEMLKTFNCGMGMVAVCKRDRAQAVGDTFEAAGHTVAVIGEVVAGEGVRYTGKLL